LLTDTAGDRLISRSLLVNCRAHNPDAENSLAETIKTYQHLIAKMPKPNQYLLLYVLDLLSVFARKSEVNLMTAPSELLGWTSDSTTGN
jgi:hypothetical protein